MPIRLAWSSQFDHVIAFSTVYRPIFTRLEGHLGIFAALRTYGREHWALGTITTAIVLGLFCFSYLAARWATLRFIIVAFDGKQLLFFSTEGKGSTTIRALQRFVLIINWTTSSLF